MVIPMWEPFVEHKSIDEILHDKGLAKVGDNLVNFCYSLAKSKVLGYLTGEKVRDSVLARAIRATDAYKFMHKRTDVGKAADAYEALMAYLWMKNKITIPEMVETLVETLDITSTTSRKKEGEIAAVAFQKFLQNHLDALP